MASQQPKKSQPKRRPIVSILIGLALALIAFVLWQNGVQIIPDPSADQTVSIGEENPSESSSSTSSEETTESPPPQPPQQVSDLSPIAYTDLPPEAHDTIELIDQGGPFPYDKDGSTFQNREGVLPDNPNGYYSEYTVITPDSSDRGARRIVAGTDGEMYYTDDHYDSFEEIIR